MRDRVGDRQAIEAIERLPYRERLTTKRDEDGRLFLASVYPTVRVVCGVRAVVREHQLLCTPNGTEQLRNVRRQRLARNESNAYERLMRAREESQKLIDGDKEEWWGPVLEEWKHELRGTTVSMAGAYNGNDG